MWSPPPAGKEMTLTKLVDDLKVEVERLTEKNEEQEKKIEEEKRSRVLWQKSVDELSETPKKEEERCSFWEKRASETNKKYEVKLKELEEAHALIGRLTHQLSKRWDTAPLTKYMTGLLDKG